MKVILAICFAAAAADVSLSVYTSTDCSGATASDASVAPGSKCVQCGIPPTPAPATTTAGPTTTAAPTTTTTAATAPTATSLLNQYYYTSGACANCLGTSDGCYFTN